MIKFKVTCIRNNMNILDTVIKRTLEYLEHLKKIRYG